MGKGQDAKKSTKKEAAKTPKEKKAALWRDLFLFSVYAGGLRFSDVIEMQYKHYNKEEHRINKLIRKTGRVHQFKIGKVAIDILDKYMKEDANKEDYIFPIIEDKIFLILSTVSVVLDAIDRK